MSWETATKFQSLWNITKEMWISEDNIGAFLLYFLWFLLHCCPVISLVDAIRLLLVATPINRGALKQLLLPPVGRSPATWIDELIWEREHFWICSAKNRNGCRLICRCQQVFGAIWNVALIKTEIGHIQLYDVFLLLCDWGRSSLRGYFYGLKFCLIKEL